MKHTINAESPDSEKVDLSWLSNPPRHVAVIMDGNGRWATKRHLPRVMGHRAGAESVRRVVTASRQWNIPYLTLYAFSWENWTRPRLEVNALMALLEEFIDQEIQTMLNNSIRFSVVGARERLPESVFKKIRMAEDRTSACDRMVLTLALSYSGREEIVKAATAFARDVQKGILSPEDLSAERFSDYLDSRDLPPPDLLIRTSGEVRVSNFLLWQIAYTELHFTRTLWPDFSEEDYRRALMDYQERVRRFGRTGATPDEGAI
ncbi:isoprenyl transferase [Leptospirillum ferrooxidans]|jgi:undecaprenyl diphosphate synthase|uniref:Isoprenyl transferase n=1 Tax=Leptospirillum ferrooxidans (strain C2-3) TaxID=1162668 RepID=I0IQS5_LEPFC|nr:isoprenyl transferase [Leptospirillum ferrooxidans]BAM07624.1 undecaprenyl diphosphate synthase [Leptospirillum ferrooxidans C2-3]